MPYNKIMKLYNTLTRTKEDFKPVKKDVVSIYSCGPTVYYTAHIGNLRAYICGDILKKVLRYNGFKINDVMNITDVGHLVGDGDDGEDKVEKTAKATGLHPLEIAKKYTDIFLRDVARLNIDLSKHIVPATTCIPEMIELIKQLEDKDAIYSTSDGIYFDASKFPRYFELSKGNIDGNNGGARVDLGEKRNINDFALWKFVTPNTIQKWDSPWGVGCPGWHIECSAISAKFLELPFDIHTGGVDHIPIHHTNEIAQTETATGKAMSNFWFHNEFMTIDGGKMSKSLGNVYSLDDLIAKGYSAMDFRYLMLQTTYRSVVNFTFTALDSAKKTYKEIINNLSKHYASQNKTDKKLLAELEQEFHNAINNDLNTPMALAVLHKALKSPLSIDIYDLVTKKFDSVLSLSLANATNEKKEIIKVPDEIIELAEKRLTEKKNKNYAAADELRKQIESAGYIITDTSNSYNIEKK